eukprot:357916-Chlamydomonas_euryale.AAC.15
MSASGSRWLQANSADHACTTSRPQDNSDQERKTSRPQDKLRPRKNTSSVRPAPRSPEVSGGCATRMLQLP